MTNFFAFFLHRHSMGVDQWGARGTLTTPRPEGVSIKIVLIHFQFIKKFIGIYSETDHYPLLKTLHRSSSKINNKINCMVGNSPQLDLGPVNIHHARLCQAHNRLLICVCPVTLGLQPGIPDGYLYRLRRNKRIYALCVI